MKRFHTLSVEIWICGVSEIDIEDRTSNRYLGDRFYCHGPPLLRAWNESGFSWALAYTTLPSGVTSRNLEPDRRPFHMSKWEVHDLLPRCILLRNQQSDIPLQRRWHLEIEHTYQQWWHASINSSKVKWRVCLSLCSASLIALYILMVCWERYWVIVVKVLAIFGPV